MDDRHITPDDMSTMDALGRALPRVAPPADLGDRIMAAASEPAPVIRLDERRARRRVVLSSIAAAACAAAVAVGVTLAITGDASTDMPGPLTASTQVVGTAGDGVSGTASLYGADAAGGMVQVALDSVPPPPEGHHYEVWVLEKGSTEMTSVGSFTPSSGDVTLKLPLPAPAEYAAVDISVEPNGGPPAHSGTSLAGAKFT